jgi:hypothetical protein
MQPLAGEERLRVCGDYVAGPYPATLEGAVRSGLAAAREMIARAIVVGDVAGTTPQLIDEVIG